MQVAEVAAEGGNIAAAVQGHKRIILEHAVLLHTILMVQKANLELGFATEENGNVTPVTKDSFKSEKIVLKLEPFKGGPFYKSDDPFKGIDTSSQANKGNSSRQGGEKMTRGKVSSDGS